MGRGMIKVGRLALFSVVNEYECSQMIIMNLDK